MSGLSRHSDRLANLAAPHSNIAIATVTATKPVFTATFRAKVLAIAKHLIIKIGYLFGFISTTDGFASSTVFVIVRVVAGLEVLA